MLENFAFIKKKIFCTNYTFYFVTDSKTQNKIFTLLKKLQNG